MKVIEVLTSSSKKMSLFEGDSITNEIIKKGEYDQRTLNALREILALIKPGVSLDIGANVGNHSVVIADYSEYLYSFEPIPVIFDLLHRNLKNNCKNSKAFNKGLSCRSEKLEIVIEGSGNLGASSIISDSVKGDSEEIEVVEGDGFLKAQGIENVDFIKLDVEGFETNVILGLKKTIETFKPLLLIEWNCEKTISGFEENNFFESAFKDYYFFSITNISSKKLYSKSVKGKVQRLFARTILGKKWCLSDFQKNKYYSNVLFVPPRYRTIFENFELRTLSNDISGR